MIISFINLFERLLTNMILTQLNVEYIACAFLRCKKKKDSVIERRLQQG